MRINGSELVTDSKHIGGLMLEAENFPILRPIWPSSLQGMQEDLAKTYESGARYVDLELPESRLLVSALQTAITRRHQLVDYACDVESNAGYINDLLTNGMPKTLSKYQCAQYILSRASRIMHRPDMLLRTERSRHER